ncbi:MAG TPA: hypothetical protein VGR51_01935, partial [Thermoplasmata archaeon]|nr:hypothetical protein [Thermoplasmata archaeon]
MAAVSFHFHGYQPGDIVRWVEPDPLKPPRFEERNSPVALTIRDRKVKGRNWTDTVLHAYGSMEATLESAGGAASVDIEPQTLVWLLEKDPAAYRRALASWDKGVAGLVMTPPFHPILPHHHRLERETLFEIMMDFYAPILRRQAGRSIGLWLPETAYSEDTLRDFYSAARRSTEEGTFDLMGRTHLVLDERQLRQDVKTAWSRVGVEGGLPAVARDHGLSGDFAFGTSSAREFVTTAKTRNADSLLIASDLESLLANPTQADRFEAIVEGLRGAGVETTAPAPPREMRPAELVEYSSWSDYDDQLREGHTSDTRWTGMRRSDGLVIARVHRGEPMSQLWKHAFMLATEQIETAVRRVGRDLFQGFEIDRRRHIVRGLAVAYSRHLWRDHHRQNGRSDSELDFARSADRLTGGKVDVEVSAHFARAYVMMLMGLRSDPRFWDNPDTRVTFQNVVCLTGAMFDVAAVWRMAHDG